MRSVTTFLLWALVVTSAPVLAQSCGEAPVGPKRLYDRSWIRTSTIVYGVDAQGVFKLRLGSNPPQRIGDHQAQPPSHLHVSPMKRWVQYERAGASEYWLYDVARAQEHRLDVQSSGPVQLQLSPDETALAWLERKGGEHQLAIIDLARFETRRLRLLEAPDPKAVFFDLTWSTDGKRLTYAWRDAERQEFYSVDLGTGLVKFFPPPREFGADEFIETAYLIGGDAPIMRPLRQTRVSIALEGGAMLRYANRKLTIARPKKNPRTIAELPAGCTPALLDAFDGRYALYRTGSTYWIYGLREGRNAILFKGPGLLEW